MTYSLRVPYAIDLGNGFTKRKFSDKVITEPSIIGVAPDFYNQDNFSSFSLNDEVNHYIGDDVINAGVTPFSVLGEEETQRYNSHEFKKLLFSFIAKDVKTSVTIPYLITGLPINHFKSQVDYLTNMIKGKKVIKVDGNELIIDIRNVNVLPQPIGTYMYLVSKGIVNSQDEMTLVIDGGHGTLDITEMKGKTIIRRAGKELGVKNSYIDIFNYLVDQFGELRGLTVNNMHYILQNGMRYDKKLINVLQLTETEKILRNNFNEVYNFIRENRFDLKSYDNVVWTGGMALLHNDLILEKQRNNFIILKDGQTANVNGYYEFGRALIKSEENSALR